MKGCGDDATRPQAALGVGGRVLEAAPGWGAHRRGLPANRDRPQDRVSVARRGGWSATGAGGWGDTLAALPDVAGTPAHRDLARAQARYPRDRPPNRAGTVDGLAGAAPASQAPRQGYVRR